MSVFFNKVTLLSHEDGVALLILLMQIIRVLVYKKIHGFCNGRVL